MMPEGVDERLLTRLRDAQERFRDVEEQLASPDVTQDLEKLKLLGRQRADLNDVHEAADQLLGLLDQLEGAQELLREAEDPEMRSLAEMEADDLRDQLTALALTCKELLIPKDPLDNRAAVIEIRAGTGGDEAGLFARELMRMYQRMSERSGWSVELMSMSEGIPGAIKEAIFTVRGRGVYGQLKYESGVHRVQRVPATESQGRIHTSAATVAVLPEAEEVDLHIDPNDLRIDVFRSSGPGGQSVNTTDSAVRITHIPTGTVVSQQDEKSQLKNKAKAMKVLRSRLLDNMIAEKEAERARERKLQIGTGDRSGKIRTYNFPQNRVTDHRISLTLHKLPEILDGDLSEVIGALRLADQEERMEGADA
jgi:peptide chain release factor 1